MDTSSIIQPDVTPVFWTDHKVRSYQLTRPWPAWRTFIPPRDLNRYFVQIQVRRMTDRFNRILVLSNTTPEWVEYQ